MLWMHLAKEGLTHFSHQNKCIAELSNWQIVELIFLPRLHERFPFFLGK